MNMAKRKMHVKNGKGVRGENEGKGVNKRK